MTRHTLFPEIEPYETGRFSRSMIRIISIGSRAATPKASLSSSCTEGRGLALYQRIDGSLILATTGS